MVIRRVTLKPPNFPTQNVLQGSLSGGSSYDAWVLEFSLPAAPVFTNITGGASTSSGVVTDSTSPTLSGTATPGSTVTISRADLGVLGTATATGGSWSYSTTLAAGTYTFTATRRPPAA